MCQSFDTDFNKDVQYRYQKPSFKYAAFGDLNMLYKHNNGFVYIDKLWVKEKGQGSGTRCFKQFLEGVSSNLTLIWRTRTKRRYGWYMRFAGVKHVATHNGYYFFVFNKGSRGQHGWTYEDLDLFKEPSLTTS
jgi:hypothetical protein